MTMKTVASATLYRIAAVAGFGSAVVLLINAAKRAEVIPTSAFTQLVAPLAQIMAAAAVTGLYFAVGRRTGTVGLVAFLLNAFALTSLVGVEFVINLVFRELPPETIEALRAGPLGVALTVASVLFLVGSLFFIATVARVRELPVVALVLYGVGAIPVAFRAFVPEVALDLGLVMLAAGLAWLAAWLLQNYGRATATDTTHRTPAAARTVGGRL
jgi:hypothetical protein